MTDLATSTPDRTRGRRLAAKRRGPDQQLGTILATPSHCDPTRTLQTKIARARDQLPVSLDHPGDVEATNNGCERALRPAVVPRKTTNGDRAMWAAEGEAALRTIVDTVHLTGSQSFSTIIKTIGA